MEVFNSLIDTTSSEFKDNFAFNKNILNELQSKIATAKKGGDEESVLKHKKRNKFLPRERIEKVLDSGSPFLELSTLAANEVYESDVPGAGIVTGIGKVHGILCMFVANDATVKGGTYFPLTVKKHLRAQEIALENKLPCIYLVDSGGAFLPKQDEVFPDKEHFGRIFFNQAQMSSQGIPQLAAVLGSCTAGGAYVPAMSDESIIVKGNGTIFLGGPPLVKAATGEEVTAEDLGGAMVHTSKSGVADHFAENEEEALLKIRDVVENINYKKATSPAFEVKKPAYDSSEIYGVLPKDVRKQYDVREIIARIVDGSEFHEFKKNYGTTLVCCFAKIHGQQVGIIANNGILFSESSLKGAHFIELCEQRRIPIVFLQNITGFMVGKEYESKGIAKDGAKLVTAVSTATVPKITIVIGGSFGAGNYGMCGRAFGPRFMFMWPSSKISVMGGEQAANVLATVKQDGLKAANKKMLSEKEVAEFKQPILDKYEKEGSAYYSTARIWDDGIIEPHQTRDILGLVLNTVENSNEAKKKFGIFRM
ncbi:MAG: methylcrotonoyl-CoA carboxylase [Bacteriovoracaceae bacterium]|nr:methylcrotonoyl-CoA carboxylase [Bacteriovoracaceae bacterium]